MLSGPQATVDALCRTLGVAVTRYVQITMAGLAQIVDTVGGLDVTIPHPIRDSYSGLDIARTGRVHVNGTQALALVRSRSPQELIDGRWVTASEAAGAADRTGRAGEVFRALQRKARATVPNPIAMQALAWSATGALTTDTHTGLSDLFGLRGTSRVTAVPAQQLGKVIAVGPDAATIAAITTAGITGGCR